MGSGYQIGACDIKKGTRVYETDLRVSGDLDPEQWVQSTHLLPHEDQEIIIQRLKQLERTVIRVIDGEKGIIRQEFAWSAFRSAYREQVQVIPERKSFRVVSSFVVGQTTSFERRRRLCEPFSLGVLIRKFSMERNGSFVCTNTAALMPSMHHPTIHPSAPVAYAPVKFDCSSGPDFQCAARPLVEEEESRQKITDEVKQALGGRPFDFTIHQFVRPGQFRTVRCPPQIIRLGEPMVEFVNASWLQAVSEGMLFGPRSFHYFLNFM